MNITITDVVPFRLIGVYDNAGTWTQASGTNFATALGVLDAVATTTGIKTGTIYADGETLLAVDTDIDVEVEFFAFLDGILSGTLTTVSDATIQLIINLLGNTIIKNNHGVGCERRLPTGSAFHDEIQRAVFKSTGYEFRQLEIDINDRAKVDNMLFGYNLAYWQETLNLIASGTVAEQELAIIRKLSDIGGLQAADLTRELHNAGFTNLYAYANKFPIDMPDFQMGLDVQMGFAEMAQYKTFIAIDPRVYENFIPYEVMGEDVQMGLDVQMGFYNSGADLVVKSSENESDMWDYIQPNFRLWSGCFFICGDEFGKIASVDIDRKKELRKLICEIKPFKSFGVMFVIYS